MKPVQPDLHPLSKDEIAAHRAEVVAIHNEVEAVREQRKQDTKASREHERHLLGREADLRKALRERGT